MQSDKLVIITARVHQLLIDRLTEKGYRVSYQPHITYNELYDVVDQAEGLIVTTRIAIDKRMIDRAEKLKWIGRLGSGMELIDVDYASTKGIKCVSSPEGNRNAVAEHVIGMLLGLLHKINSSHQEIQKGIWIREENRGTELAGKTVGIIGYGNTGSSFARLLGSFGVTVLAYDKNRFGFSEKYIKEANLDQICRYADVISFHVPLNGETKYMGNEQFFTSLQQCPVIINTSRGSVINTHDLMLALIQNKISGAALDVLENEQLEQLSAAQKEEFEYLTRQSNVILTPHIAGYSKEAFSKMSEVILEKLEI